jgi:hypothetical protein
MVDSQGRRSFVAAPSFSSSIGFAVGRLGLSRYTLSNDSQSSAGYRVSLTVFSKSLGFFSSALPTVHLAERFRFAGRSETSTSLEDCEKPHNEDGDRRELKHTLQVIRSTGHFVTILPPEPRPLIPMVAKSNSKSLIRARQRPDNLTRTMGGFPSPPIEK